jgi:hypothetical protein
MRGDGPQHRGRPEQVERAEGPTKSTSELPQTETARVAQPERASSIPAASAPAEPTRAANVQGSAPQPAAPLTTEPLPGIEGTWLWAPAPGQATPKGLYAPEYIEVRLFGHGASVHGKYRARYRVTDQAISSSVVFDFDAPKGAALVAPWQDSYGARGEIQLRLITDSKLEVKWVARQLSDHLNLTSGTATLYRAAER